MRSRARTVLRAAAPLAVGVAIGTVARVYGPALARYIAFGILYGDWLNDWVTHLPVIAQKVALLIVGGG